MTKNLSFEYMIVRTGSAQGEAAERQGRRREGRVREWGGGVTAAGTDGSSDTNGGK
jgi:hypothetical protein